MSGWVGGDGRVSRWVVMGGLGKWMGGDRRTGYKWVGGDGRYWVGG